MKEYIARIYKYTKKQSNQRSFSLESKLATLKKLDSSLVDIDEEHCYYAQTNDRALTNEELRQLLWLVEANNNGSQHQRTNSNNGVRDVLIVDGESYLRENATSAEDASKTKTTAVILEVGPRLSLCSPFSTNAVSILKSLNPTTALQRIERSTIFKLSFECANDAANDDDDSAKARLEALKDCLHDKMVESIYTKPITTFNPSAARAKNASGELELQPSAEVDVLRRGELALRDVSAKLGLFLDDWDIDYYTSLFCNTIKRNPTIVECFDLAQSNSEHSRHWFFKGELSIEGRPSEKQPLMDGASLIDLVASTQVHSSLNNVIKFEDNSSAIEGFQGLTLLAPLDSSRMSEMNVVCDTSRHIIFTAETHNFPTGVAPFPGAATGTGGRIRDVQATGRGGHVIAGTAGYSFGNLLLDDHNLDWEDSSELYPNKLAIPARIAIEASNGASDYGNKFGEPIIAGFARSFGMRLKSSTANSGSFIVGDVKSKTERWEYLKPIMFTGGIGTIDASYTKKVAPRIGMQVAKIGGPVYRIGIGGGAASSADEGKMDSQLDFNAVQRGDPEMEQKLNRFIRACIESKSGTDACNPILSIHDQGAGGNANVLKEIVEPLGAVIDANKFTLGDKTVNILELWAAEYQESVAVLIENSKHCNELVERISRREKCNIDVVGVVGCDGQIKLANFKNFNKQLEKRYPIDLKLDYVIGSMPRKKFTLTDYDHDEFLCPARLSTSSGKRRRKKDSKHDEINFLRGTTKTEELFGQLLERVLKLPSVASKRYLMAKVDRCVTGLIAGQQCLGPLHTPIADYALIALTHFDRRGSVTSIGEQPIKGLVSPISNATMSVAEALTNMMFCAITSIEDIKCSANWMWAAKLNGEGAKLVDTCVAMCKLMQELGVAIDGGKDSLSMSARVDPSDARRLSNKDKSPIKRERKASIVKSPGTLVISAYAPVPDIQIKVTPILECQTKLSHLLYVNLAHPADLEQTDVPRFRLGGSALLQTLGQIGQDAPSIDFPAILRDGFVLVQELIKEGICTAGHDISDGGLVVCALEMAIASHCGLHLNIKAEKAFKALAGADESEIFAALFAEECGAILEVEAATATDLEDIIARFEASNINAQRIGFGSYENKRIEIKFEYQSLLHHEDNHRIRDLWESTSMHLDLLQTKKSCVKQEYENLSKRPSERQWDLTFDPNYTQIVENYETHYLTHQPKVAVIREEGINGDREMIASLAMAGFQVYDVTVTDLISKTQDGATLAMFDGLVFPGGFSFADVFGSGKGWAASFVFNESLRKQLFDFCKRPKTFSLGVCNGCQFMSLLGLLEDDVQDAVAAANLKEKPKSTVRLVQNDSGRFECRFVNVSIEATTNAIMLEGMETSTFGVWVAHGEGKFIIDHSSSSIYTEIDPRIALRYVDDSGNPTMEYPLNPNGSLHGIAGMCSRDGRHLAMMPHPERCTQLWQWPYVPKSWSGKVTKSPWMRMFVNAYKYCKNS